MLRMQSISIIVFTLVHCAVAGQVSLVGNANLKVNGKSKTVQVTGCAGVASMTALALFPGTMASFTFTGTSVNLLGVSIPQGADALVSIDHGGPFRVDASSISTSCKSFLQLSTNDTIKPHTLFVSVLKEPKTPLDLIIGLIPWLKQDESVFLVRALDIIPPTTATTASKPLDPVPTEPPKETGPPLTPPPQACSTIEPTNAPEVTSSSDPPDSSVKPEDHAGSSDTATADPSGGAEEGNNDSSSNNSIDDGPFSTDPPYTITATDGETDTPGPTAAASNNDPNGQVTSGSAGGGSKASTIVPAVLVPLAAIGMVLGALWVLRNRGRRRIPPSTAFRMANPEYIYAPGTRREMGQVDDRDDAWSPFHEERR
ncbi:hypothetical protein BKA62DRAFT_715663 [Auriculariales sp. MPI-PUGE-AT-0066]|nr:hypothetical protein BKA62DRAFT_715663 [Auriculariales sp. MPI-PUGE-AT-0066]